MSDRPPRPGLPGADSNPDRATPGPRGARTSGPEDDEFYSTLAHELRSPLNAILGWTQLLGSGNLEPGKVRHALEVIERNIHAQMVLIDDLLDMSRIARGPLRLTRVPIDLIALVSAAIETFQLQAGQRRIQIVSRLEAIPGVFSGDPDRLQQIVANLLAHAVQTSPEGG